MQHGGHSARTTVDRSGGRRRAIVVATTLGLGAASFVGVGLTTVTAHASARFPSARASALTASTATAPKAAAPTTAAPTAAPPAAVPAAQTTSSNGGAAPTENTPWTVDVTTPIAGGVRIRTNPTSEHADSQPLADVTINASAATVAEPLRLTFKVYVGDLPTATYPSDVRIYRDGSEVGGCGHATAADGCVSSTSVADGVATYTVLSSKSDDWRLDTPVVGRLSGSDRFATAVAASQAEFPSASRAEARAPAREARAPAPALARLYWRRPTTTPTRWSASRSLHRRTHLSYLRAVRRCPQPRKPSC